MRALVTWLMATPIRVVMTFGVLAMLLFSGALQTLAIAIATALSSVLVSVICILALPVLICVFGWRAIKGMLGLGGSHRRGH